MRTPSVVEPVLRLKSASSSMQNLNDLGGPAYFFRFRLTFEDVYDLFVV